MYIMGLLEIHNLDAVLLWLSIIKVILWFPFISIFTTANQNLKNK